jgi:CPA2 family monovalent cation:H+ antiporter-2
VLLFQDISVIPILALLPLLALSGSQVPSGEHVSFLSGLPGWAQTLTLLVAVNLVVLCGHFMVVPFLRFIARIHLRELFTAAALLIIVGTASVMMLVGLSPALGAFLAGVVLANSEFRHELESDIEPFMIIALVCSIIVIKAGVLFVGGSLVKLSFDQNLLFTLGLAQVGEFAFVLFSFIHQLDILSARWTDMMMGVTAITMTITPLLLLINERLILPRFGTKEKEGKEADEIDESNPVIIAGFGHFGSTLGRFLRASGVGATILDNDSDRVDLLRKMGFKVFYGDATRIDILKSAGAGEARILIAAIDSPEINFDLVEKTKNTFPNLTIMVRARNRLDAYELLDMGINDVYRESLDTSVRLGIDVLVKLGIRKYSATRAGQNFIKYDETALRELATHRHDKSNYIFNTREQIQIQEQLLTRDREANPNANDHAWDSDLFEEKPKSDKA